MNYGLIGNCAYSALVKNGAVEWLCWPRLDSSFVFGALLDAEKGGSFTVEGRPDDAVEQGYIENTNVLRTVFEGADGAFELIDFAPRFGQYQRYFKPTMLMRILRPLRGEPLARISIDPTYDYGRVRAQRWLASNHIQYHNLPGPLRLTTSVPLTYVDERRPFVLDRTHYLVLSWGQPLESGLEETCENFLRRTLEYWRGWVKGSRVPRDYQQQVIRSALTLKLHQFEDTGALIAATTTSIPEHPGSGRNWDYRYCWLRDAYFTLHAFERLGQTEEMERFLLYLRNICENFGDDLQPLYGIACEAKIEEHVLEHLAGYQGDGPVRIGNQAYVQPQYDVYGEMILAISRMLLDVRFAHDDGVRGARQLIDVLLAQVERNLEEPDSGLWELRGQRHLHTFSLLMHWAGARRAAEIGEVLGDVKLAQRAQAILQRSHQVIFERCWDDKRGVLVQAAGQPHLDAATLLALHFRFFGDDQAKARSHVDTVRKALSMEDGLLRRYDSIDDFGEMKAAFTVCSFWLAQALARSGREQQARVLFDKLLALHNGLGLYSEDLLPGTLQQAGNFPQTYSHVGLINTAFLLSRKWE